MLKMIDIDFAGGVEINANTPKYNIKAICEYCKKNNIDIEKLTEEDLKPFIVGYMKENHHNLLTDEMIEKMKKDEEN